jgi:hypothetical protein
MSGSRTNDMLEALSCQQNVCADLSMVLLFLTLSRVLAMRGTRMRD